MKITKSEFGTTKNGSIINLFHLENTSGAYVEIIDFGCRLTKIVVPDRNGDPVDVCLGFSTADHYADDDASSVLQQAGLPTASKMATFL